MATIKSHTDLPQSKKLAEFLPLESADMCYRIVAINLNDTHEYRPYCFPITLKSDIPCWSLAALLGIIPSGKALIHDKGNLGYKCICNNMDTYFHDNPVDACVEMIIKLHEQKLL